MVASYRETEFTHTGKLPTCTVSEPDQHREGVRGGEVRRGGESMSMVS